MAACAEAYFLLRIFRVGVILRNKRSTKRGDTLKFSGEAKLAGIGMDYRHISPPFIRPA